MFHKPFRVGPDVAAASDVYARRFAGAVGSWMLDVQTRTLDAFLAGWEGCSILDVGGGHAQITPHLLAQGRDVTTLISSPEAGERLRRESGGRAECIVGEVEELTVPEGSFDVVVAVRMMAHVADWRRFLASLARVARRGVIVDYPISGGVNALSPLLFRIKKSIEGDTRPYACMHRREVEAVLAAEGLVPDRHVGEFVVPMGLHRLLRTRAVSRGVEAALRPLAPTFGNPVLLRASRPLH
jgi:SAM-dependent methyltransferase